MKLILSDGTELNLSNTVATMAPYIIAPTMSEVSAEIDKLPKNYYGTIIFRDDTDTPLEDGVLEKTAIKVFWTGTEARADIPLRIMDDTEKQLKDLKEVTDALLSESLGKEA